MFALLSTVQNFLSNNKRIYVAFVDLKKCFDRIYRNALWLKLFRADKQGKMLRIVKCMYEKVKSCVKSCNNFSDFLSTWPAYSKGRLFHLYWYLCFWRTQSSTCKRQ